MTKLNKISNYILKNYKINESYAPQLIYDFQCFLESSKYLDAFDKSKQFERFIFIEVLMAAGFKRTEINEIIFKLNEI